MAPYKRKLGDFLRRFVTVDENLVPHYSSETEPLYQAGHFSLRPCIAGELELLGRMVTWNVND